MSVILISQSGLADMRLRQCFCSISVILSKLVLCVACMFLLLFCEAQQGATPSEDTQLAGIRVHALGLSYSVTFTYSGDQPSPKTVSIGWEASFRFDSPISFEEAIELVRDIFDCHSGVVDRPSGVSTFKGNSPGGEISVGYNCCTCRVGTQYLPIQQLIYFRLMRSATW